ncbi:MAG TPA: dihydrofolate reductase family protein [Candidatus Bathyarchaeia archaeon]|nr:dihydrofolate reductase family protein [Candidatus Bathyarchaeia archaeon]
MRRVIVSNVMSLDGFVSGLNGELNWFVYAGFVKGTEFGEYARILISSVDSILLGRLTYEEFSSYWPTAKDDDPVITERINNLPKFVFSRSLKQVAWGDWGTAGLVKEEATVAVSKMKQETGRDIVIYGSATLVSTLMKAGLIDEYQLVIYPVVLGKGRPEFKDLTQRYPLSLTDVKQFKSGAVKLVYHPLRRAKP